MNAAYVLDRSYATIRQRLLTGAYRPGQRLEANRIAGDLAVSMTPVRDALNRLTGEGLVEAEVGEGFRVPFVTSDGLRGLIDWNRHLSLLCARRIRRRLEQHNVTDDMDYADRATLLFSRLAKDTGLAEAVSTMDRISARLHRLRMIEAELIPSATGEIVLLGEAFDNGDRRQLGRLLEKYHRIRLRIVPDLVRRIRPDPKI